MSFHSFYNDYLSRLLLLFRFCASTLEKCRVFFFSFVPFVILCIPYIAKEKIFFFWPVTFVSSSLYIFFLFFIIIFINIVSPSIRYAYHQLYH
ncbi:hypothetical protein STCU_10182 [Strigomonas culicis]|uniref:Uncharacterized protein n=1 Tax=Strigomonas culicis TaxID=28005 RepID=S9V5H4_9TRYP|nr:hypothetical protein STCU_10182 [Strigomonas culicis]|eukprot:EPY18115.1 hypothetical protein STCU_10182 [Strigomonas culicis]